MWSIELMHYIPSHSCPRSPDHLMAILGALCFHKSNSHYKKNHANYLTHSLSLSLSVGLKSSLQRLQLEYVDVVFANRPDSNTPMEGR